MSLEIFYQQMSKIKDLQERVKVQLGTSSKNKEMGALWTACVREATS